MKETQSDMCKQANNVFFLASSTHKKELDIKSPNHNCLCLLMFVSLVSRFLIYRSPNE